MLVSLSLEPCAGAEMGANSPFDEQLDPLPKTLTPEQAALVKQKGDALTRCAAFDDDSIYRDLLAKRRRLRLRVVDPR